MRLRLRWLLVGLSASVGVTLLAFHLGLGWVFLFFPFLFFQFVPLTDRTAVRTQTPRSCPDGHFETFHPAYRVCPECGQRLM